MFDSSWYAIEVRTGQEATVAAVLETKGLATLLPTHTARRRWSDRVKQIRVPLFPGYVFCRLPVDGSGPRAVTTKGVLRIVGFGGGPQALADSEVRLLECLVQAGSSAVPWPYIEPGRRVRIDNGPFAGLDGTVLKAPKGLRLVVSLDLLQRSVAVELDRQDIIPMRAAVGGQAS